MCELIKTVQVLRFTLMNLNCRLPARPDSGVWMHLLIVSGFLGSGKTTFVIKLAEAAIQKGRKVAIIVNELGEVGIDDQLMNQLDMNVWQMLNGCICCTLSKDLPAALEKLGAKYSPDLVLMEPTGAADLEKVLSSLDYYRGQPLKSRRNIVLLDPLRLKKLYHVLGPLIKAQVRHADLILINKADLATDLQMEETREIADGIKPGSAVKAITAKQKIDGKLLAEVLP